MHIGRFIIQTIKSRGGMCVPSVGCELTHNFLLTGSQTGSLSLMGITFSSSINLSYIIVQMTQFSEQEGKKELSLSKKMMVINL